MTTEKLITYKGFDIGLKCRDFQFTMGAKHTHYGLVSACHSGFHSCKSPLDVFNYYPPATSVYAEVEPSGVLHSKSGGDSKLASAELTLTAVLDLAGLAMAHVKYVRGNLIPNETPQATNTGIQSAATNTGIQSAATNTGIQSAATNTGSRSAATNTGSRSAATNTGSRSAATNTGSQSAATNTGSQSAATNTGIQSAATNTGIQSAATNTGIQSAAEVSGESSVAIAIGIESRAKASKSGAIVLCYRLYDGTLKHIRAGMVGKKGLKADTWYRLNSRGQFVQVKGV